MSFQDSSFPLRSFAMCQLWRSESWGEWGQVHSDRARDLSDQDYDSLRQGHRWRFWWNSQPRENMQYHQYFRKDDRIQQPESQSKRLNHQSLKFDMQKVSWWAFYLVNRTDLHFLAKKKGLVLKLDFEVVLAPLPVWWPSCRCHFQKSSYGCNHRSKVKIAEKGWKYKSKSECRLFP